MGISWSVQKIQNLSRNYRNFTPSTGLYYTQSKAGVTKMARIDFRTQMTYPTLREQLSENLDLSFSDSHQKPTTGGAFSWAANARGV